MSEPATTLKRNRPKTNWVWYTTAVSASLIIGIGITVSYAMQKTPEITKAKELQKPSHGFTPVIKTTNTNSSTKKEIVAEKKADKETIPSQTKIIIPNLPKEPNYTRKQNNTAHKTPIKTTNIKKNAATVRNHSDKQQKPFEQGQTISIEAHDQIPAPSAASTPVQEKHRKKNLIFEVLNQLTGSVHHLLGNK